jgi:hypothetical protein
MLIVHRQLRPKVNNYNLTIEKGDGFEFNRSLFERLVLKGFPHQTLTAQYRTSTKAQDSFISKHANLPILWRFHPCTHMV